MIAADYNRKQSGRLWKLNDLPSELLAGVIDWSKFSVNVAKFQDRVGLEADGKLGPKTITALKPDPEKDKVWALDSLSTQRLSETHDELQRLFKEIAFRDHLFSVLCGYRGEEEQETAFNAGTSRAHFGESPHNYRPALAVDVAPFSRAEIDWDAGNPRWREFADVVFTVAGELGIDIQWGGRWTTINDMPHWELRNWKTMTK